MILVFLALGLGALYWAWRVDRRAPGSWSATAVITSACSGFRPRRNRRLGGWNLERIDDHNRVRLP